MGLIAFALLMAAEVMLARVLSVQSPTERLRGMTSAAGAAGLTRQVLFGLMPWWVVRRAR